MSDPGIECEAIDVRGGGGPICIVRDLLDKLLVDRRYDPMGRADGIILTVAQGQAPRVTCIESGMTVAAARVSRRLGRWARTVARRWGLSRGRAVRIGWDRVLHVGIETRLDLEADQTRALAWEHWLLVHIVRYIPSLKSPARKEGETDEQRNWTRPASEPAKRGGILDNGDEPVRGRRVRLQRLLGREVADSAGRAAGRIEEVRGHVRDGACVVESYELGREGLLERLSISDVSLALVRWLGARRGGTKGGHRVPWAQLNLDDVDHPRLRCTLSELAKMQPRSGAGERTGL
jgi:hypothetical protein